MSEETKQRAERGTDGKFLPGNSGGPGKRRMPDDVREMLLAATPKAAKALVDALEAGGELAPDYEIRIKAANAILDRVFGKANQPVSGPDGQPLRFDITPLLERLAK